MIPSSASGLRLAAADATGSESPDRTRFRTAESSAITLPARVSVPASVRRLPRTSTSRPPDRLRPSPIPAIASASLTRISRSAGLVRRMIGQMDGCTWWPSAMSSTYAASSVSAATASPGAWCTIPVIALNRCVVVRPPAAYPARASSRVATE